MGEYMNILKQMITSNSMLAYLTVFFLGFISSLNPHMLGMVPIFMGHTMSEEEKGRKWVNLIVFSLSFSVVLTVFGLVISSLGTSLHPIMQFSYILAGIIYIYIGFRLMGLRLRYKIPVKVVAFHYRRKRYGFKVLKNFLFPVIFTPCSLPFVISILTLAMVKGSILYGGLMLFSFGLGHSLIFLLFGISSKILLVLEERIGFGKIIHIFVGLIMILIGISFIALNGKMHM
jgi:cytochrome c-type biogenesis protein